MAGNNEWQSCMHISKSEMQMPWDSQSISVSRMANDSTISMGSSAMFGVYIVLFTFLAHFWLFAM